jgi:hypothetical protein
MLAWPSTTFGGPGFRGASFGSSTPSSPFASSSLPCGPACRSSRPSATSGTLRLCPFGRGPTSAGGSFLRGRTSSLPPGLLCCASNSVGDGTCCARDSFYSSVHACLGGLSYRPQNAFFLVVHAVHFLPVYPSCVSEAHTESRQGSIAHDDKAVQSKGHREDEHSAKGEFRA